MKKSGNRSSRGGFTLIEIVVSTALLTAVRTGFLMVTAASADQMSREQRLEQSNYSLSARAGQGERGPIEETIAVELSLKGTNQVWGIFEQYEITGSGENADDHMTFYRHRQRRGGYGERKRDREQQRIYID